MPADVGDKPEPIKAECDKLQRRAPGREAEELAAIEKVAATGGSGGGCCGTKLIWLTRNPPSAIVRSSNPLALSNSLASSLLKNSFWA